MNYCCRWTPCLPVASTRSPPCSSSRPPVAGGRPLITRTPNQRGTFSPSTFPSTPASCPPNPPLCRGATSYRAPTVDSSCLETHSNGHNNGHSNTGFGRTRVCRVILLFYFFLCCPRLQGVWHFDYYCTVLYIVHHTALYIVHHTRIWSQTFMKHTIAFLFFPFSFQFFWLQKL